MAYKPRRSVIDVETEWPRYYFNDQLWKWRTENVRERETETEPCETWNSNRMNDTIVISRVAEARMALKMQDCDCTWPDSLPGLFNVLCFKNDDEVRWKISEKAAKSPV
jgi:hypothetical protein